MAAAAGGFSVGSVREDLEPLVSPLCSSGIVVGVNWAVLAFSSVGVVWLFSPMLQGDFWLPSGSGVVWFTWSVSGGSGAGVDGDGISMTRGKFGVFYIIIT